MSTTEEQIASTEQPPVTPVVPVTPAAVEVKPPDPNDRHAVLKAAFEKPPTERGRHAAFQPREQGKFAGAPQFPTPPERPKFIPSLKKEVEAHWNTAPVELLQEIVRREEDHTKGVQPLKEAKTQLDELLNEFKPYEDLMRAQGGTPKTVVQNLLQTASVFHRGTPLQRAQSIAGLMQQFQIPLEHIQQLFGNRPPSPQGGAALDPNFNALAQQVQSMQSALTQRQQQEQQQNETRALTTIQKFAADPAHPHFEAVQERMLQLLQAPQVIGVDKSTMSYEDQLKAAYDTAIRLDPAIFAQVQAAQQVSQRQPAQVQRSRAAAVQVTGAPASGPAPKIDPNDRREILRNAFNRGR